MKEKKKIVGLSIFMLFQLFFIIAYFTRINMTVKTNSDLMSTTSLLFQVFIVAIIAYYLIQKCSSKCFNIIIRIIEVLLSGGIILYVLGKSNFCYQAYFEVCLYCITTIYLLENFIKDMSSDSKITLAFSFLKLAMSVTIFLLFLGLFSEYYILNIMLIFDAFLTITVEIIYRFFILNKKIFIITSIMSFIIYVGVFVTMSDMHILLIFSLMILIWYTLDELLYVYKKIKEE